MCVVFSQTKWIFNGGGLHIIMHRVHIADESGAQESADRKGPNWVWWVDAGCLSERYRDNLNIRHSHLIWPREIWAHTLFGHSLEPWVASANMKTHSCSHYSSARICTFLTHTSSSSAFPITPSLLPLLPSLHLALYPSLHPDLVSLCNSTSWTFSPSPTGSLYMSTPPTSHPLPPTLCSHCSVSNGSAPSQQIHQVEAGRASAPTNASQRLALSRSTVCRSYRCQTCMVHIHTSAHAEGYRLG